MTNLFFCWSEPRSRALARALKEHLHAVHSRPGGSGCSNLSHVRRHREGSRWFDAVERQLAKADVGVVCITREGLRSGWIHFEAGALARTIRKKRRQGGALLT